MSVGRQRVVSCVVDETIDLKAKFAQRRCKSLRQNISPRFNTASFTLVHSSEKLWSIVIFCPKREKEEEELERAYAYVYFLSYIMALYIVAWWRRKTGSNTNKGVKWGRKSWD